MCHKMCHKQSHTSQSTQKGSVIVVALFVIVIMTIMGTALVKILHSSEDTVVYEVIGTRAYAAAQSGVQWQLSQLFPLNVNGTTLCQGAINEPDISATPGLESCRISVTCDDNITHNSIQYYTITSKGICEVASIQTVRTIEVEARSIN